MGGGNKRKWQLTRQTISNMVVVAFGVLLYLSVSHLDVVRGALTSFMGVLSPFLVGLALAYLLDKLACFLQEKLLHGHRKLCILLAYLVAGILVSVLLAFIVPQLATSVVALVNNIPDYMQQLNGWITQLPIESDGLEELFGSTQTLITRLTNTVSTALPRLFGYGMAIGSGLVSAITALISSIYMLLEKEKLLSQLRKLVHAALPPQHARRVLRVCRNANYVFGGFITGKLIDSLIIGVICFVGTSILQIPYALLISVFIGVTNIIPFFGPLIGAIPCILILLIANPISALEFLVFVLLLQQFDGNILGPRILGNSTGLSPFWVLVAIVVGGGLFGLAGMILGVPTFAVLYTLVSELLDILLAQKKIDSEGNPLPEPKMEEAE